MSSAPTPGEIARDATWLAQALDPANGMVRLIAMNRDSYRQASFLDDRIMQQPVDARIIPWADLEAAAATLRRADARWIFHIGHVGSTLVSRLLGELEGVLAIREPRILRDLAVSPPELRERYISAVPRLVSRTFAGGETACIKATSFVSEIASALVPRNERALFMYARPQSYVASILAGENSVKELRLLADVRRNRLIERGIMLPPSSNDAERAAAAWACEMTALEAASEKMTDRQIAWADFDALLEDMPAGLRRVSSFFGFAGDRDRLGQIVGGPIIQRYSKAPEFEYSPSLREELIADASRHFERDIGIALAMLRTASEKSPLLASALTRAEGS